MTERRRNVKQFKAESKRLLDLMINSIYTNKEIFLRELLSNASDAIDKLYYQSLTDKSIKVNKKDLCIKIEIDKENRLLKIIDTGIGMNKEELENIWDKYYKIDKTHSREQVGSGVGLSIVKNILINHNCNYGVESIKGNGTTFYFELPKVK